MSYFFDHGYALLIGVGKHTRDPRLSLPTSVNDVGALRQTLAAPDLCGYPDNTDHLRTLINEQATNEDIKNGLAWLRDKAQKDADATALIYFSGHGYVAPKGGYYLITQDVDIDLGPHTGLSSIQFQGFLSEVKASRLLVVMDCCHAAGMAQAKEASILDEDLSNGLVAKETALRSLVDSLAQGQGRAVFSSSRGSELSYLLGDQSLSVYTYHFIEALQGAGHSAGDNMVTIASLMKHLGRAVPETTRKLHNAIQQPFQSFESTDFPVALIRGGKGVPSGGWGSVQDEARSFLATLVASIAKGVSATSYVGGHNITAGGNQYIGFTADDVVKILNAAPGQAAGRGFGVLAESMKDHKLNDAVRECQPILKSTSEGIAAINFHKGLHDLLHVLQVRVFEILRYQDASFGSSDWARAIVEHAEHDLIDIASQMTAIAKGSPWGKQELLWIDELVQLGPLLDRAVVDGDISEVRRVVSRIRRVLTIQPTRINTNLATLARALRIPDMISMLRRVLDGIRTAASTHNSLEILENALDSLLRLDTSMFTLVQMHDSWQLIESELVLIEDDVSLDSGRNLDFDELGLNWLFTQNKVGPMCLAEPNEAWTRGLEDCRRGVEEAISQRDINRLRTRFREYRHLARTRFVRVDDQLKKICGELVLASAPLDTVIRLIR
jgi:hypothetical protein